MGRLYDAGDEWLRGLSRGQYAVVLGVSGEVGVLAVGLLLSGDLLVVQAVTMGLVLFGLEYAFGSFQADDAE